MRYNILSTVIGSNLRYIGIVMLIPVIFALLYHEANHSLPFICAAFVSVILGFLFALPKTTEKDIDSMKKTEALAGVFFSWVFFSLVCAIPYLFYNFNFTNAVFESVSGITTTGATIFVDYSIYPKTLFFYRAMTQWFGGMGIVVLFIAVLPKFSVAGRQMFSAESPGPVEEKVTPRIRHTASWLWGIYLGLTVVQLIALKFCGMDFYNSLCTTLSTVSTGGLSPNAQSLMGYNNQAAVIITGIFMFLSGANFILLYKIFIQRKWDSFLKSEEFLTYLGITVFFSLSIAFFLWSAHKGSFLKSLIDSSFQVISLITSTGFASVDFIKWGADAKIMLFAAMFASACAASTAGGLKIARWIYLFKYIKREVAKIIHPNAVYPIRLEGKPVSDDTGSQIMAFCIFYFFIFALSAFVTALLEKSPTTALSGAITTLGNIGPGLSAKIGPMGSFDGLCCITKWIFIFNMLIGRLELIPFLALLHKDLWTTK